MYSASKSARNMLRYSKTLGITLGAKRFLKRAVKEG
jgi:hypothetical protein